MRIVATADLHGELPEIPPCDLLLIAGDLCPITDHSINYQRRWLERRVAPWITGPTCQAERVVWIAGNNDLALERGGPGRAMRNVAIYLQDSSVVVDGLKIYGTPWSKIIGPWAFSLEERWTPDPRHIDRPRGAGLECAFRHIPADTDILLAHSPPYGILDRTVDGEHVGSKALQKRLDEIRPRLAVFGHIHEAHGRVDVRGRDGRPGGMTLVNASLINELYEVAHEPVVIDL